MLTDWLSLNFVFMVFLFSTSAFALTCNIYGLKIELYRERTVFWIMDAYELLSRTTHFDICLSHLLFIIIYSYIRIIFINNYPTSFIGIHNAALLC